MPFNDPWQRDLEQHELDAIHAPKYSPHYAEYFAKALTIGVVNIYKRLLPRSEWTSFEEAWHVSSIGSEANNPFMGIRHAVERDVANRVAALDQKHGGHGGKGADWIETHLREMDKKIRAALGI